MNIGIIGLGRIGQIHLDSLSGIETAKVTAISDINLNICNKLGDKYGVKRRTERYEEIIHDNSIDAIWVCTPSTMHYEQVCSSLDNGKYVFCEKPLEIDKEKIKKIIHKYPDHEERLMVGFNRRFDKNFSLTKSNIKKIGNPTLLKIISRDPMPPPLTYIKQSGGIFKDMTIHDLDMVMFMLGTEIESVFANGYVHYVPEINGVDFDTAMVTLRYKNGTMCHIDNSRKSVYGYDQRLEILGDEGMLKVDNIKNNETSFFSHKKIEGSVYKDFFIDRYKESYKIEAISFIDSIQNKQKFPVTAYDALYSLILAELCMESCKSHKEIKVVFDEE